MAAPPPASPLPGPSGPTRQRPPIAGETEARYRTPDRLRVNDPVPPLELRRLDAEGSVRLDAFAGDRPLVLIFGSCT